MLTAADIRAVKRLGVEQLESPGRLVAAARTT